MRRIYTTFTRSNRTANAAWKPARFSRAVARTIFRLRPYQSIYFLFVLSRFDISILIVLNQPSIHASSRWSGNILNIAHSRALRGGTFHVSSCQVNCLQSRKPFLLPCHSQVPICSCRRLPGGCAPMRTGGSGTSLRRHFRQSDGPYRYDGVRRGRYH